MGYVVSDRVWIVYKHDTWCGCECEGLEFIGVFSTHSAAIAAADTWDAYIEVMDVDMWRQYPPIIDK